jgi:hypothetical protein
MSLPHSDVVQPFATAQLPDNCAPTQRRTLSPRECGKLRTRADNNETVRGQSAPAPQILYLGQTPKKCARTREFHAQPR